MPDECYLKAHTKSRMNCRNDILDFCNSVEEEETMLGSRRGCYNWGKTAFALDGSVDAQPLPGGGFRHHYECQTKCAQDDSCEAFTFKYFTAFTTLPGRGHCYFFDTKPETYAGAESRFYVSGPDHCTEFDSTPIDTPRNQEVQIAEDLFYEELDSEFAVSAKANRGKRPDGKIGKRSDCKECAAAYDRNGGCKYARKDQWYKIRKPDECYLKLHPKAHVNCRPYVMRHCKSKPEEVKSEFALSKENKPRLARFAKPEDCQACASAYDTAGGCKFALKNKWYVLEQNPSECYLKLNPKSAMNCRKHVINHCKIKKSQFASLVDNLNGSHTSVKIFSIVGFISTIYLIAKAVSTTDYKKIPAEPKPKTLKFIA